MYKINRFFTLLICVWLVLSMLIIFIPLKVQAPTVLPIVTLGLDQSYQEADVSPNGTGWVEFTGTVSCELNDATRAVVELQSTDTWDSSTITPSALQFSRDSPEDKTFRVSVTAPLGTSRNVVGQVTVTGSVIMYPGGIYGTVQPSEGVTGRIDILPYYGFSLHCNESSIDAEPGSEAVYELIIQNKGNIRDTFSISIINPNDLINEGFEISLSSAISEIEENMKQKIIIEVKVPQSGTFVNREFEIEVEVISELGSMEDVLPPKTKKLNLKIISGGLDPIDGSGENEGDESGSSFLPGFEPIFLITSILIVILFISHFSKKKYRFGK